MGTREAKRMLKSVKGWWASLPPTVRMVLRVGLKVGITAVAFYALLGHKIDVGEGERATILEAIQRYVPNVDSQTFWTFCALAGGIKFIGVLSSAWSWHLLLVGQGVRFPFWRQIVTTFLIGRFIGTFMPSTIGLDGYTLYDAGRYSGQWERVTLAKALEKLIGMTGLFLGMLLMMPFGLHIFGERAALMGGIIGTLAGGVVLAVFLAVFRPSLLQAVLRVKFPGRAKVEGRLQKLHEAAGAYKDQPWLLVKTFFFKFLVHYTTAVVYVFTAIAVGVKDVDFGAVTFASTIQILGTVFSPTIAGEGTREALQAFLLNGHMDPVQAVLSGALGFIAAEAATLWGGGFWWLRKPGYRPAFTLVDGNPYVAPSDEPEQPPVGEQSSARASA
jgi:hypothetical protein